MDTRKKTKLNSESKNFDAFLNYYQEQMSQQDLQQFIDIIDAQLPLTFRLNINNSFHQNLFQTIQEKYPLFEYISINNMKIFQMNASKLELRKDPEMDKYKKFIHEQTNLHNIYRQELVSMIPVSILNLQKDDYILDMCAAPGSKALQILENMIYLNKNNDNQSLAIINELDPKRSYMLAHQTLSLQYPNVIIINNDATTIPKIITYDKIICDVPCSGDGTFRKNKLIIKTFSNKYAYNLHSLQIKLLLQGLYLLKEQGTLVYSTCSLNPIENEAVVSAVLNILQNHVQIVDFQVQNLKMRDGMKQWKVYVKNGNEKGYFLNYKTNFKKEYLKSFFSDNVHPDIIKTKRIYPQDNNSGAFYIAKFKKSKDFDFSLIEEYFKQEEQQQKIEKSIQQNQDEQKNEEQQTNLVFFKELYESELFSVFAEDMKLYGIQQNDQIIQNFIASYPQNMKIQNSKKIHYFPKSLHQIYNEFQNLDYINIVQIGINIFKKDRSDLSKTTFRILLEGAKMLQNYIKQQIIQINEPKIYKLLINNLPYQYKQDSIINNVDNVDNFDSSDFQKMENIQQLMMKLDNGTIIFQCEKNNQLVFTAWKGISQITLQISKEDLYYQNYILEHF